MFLECTSTSDSEQHAFVKLLAFCR